MDKQEVINNIDEYLTDYSYQLTEIETLNEFQYHVGKAFGYILGLNENGLISYEVYSNYCARINDMVRGLQDKML